MTVISACQVLIFFSIAAHRVIVATLPFFRSDENLGLSILAGAVSDTALYFALALLLELLRPLNRRSTVPIGNILSVLIALLCLVGFTAHVRYMQHFGVTFHPMHLILGNTGNAVGEGLAIALSSTETLFSLLLPIAALSVVVWSSKRFSLSLRAQKWYLNCAVALVLAPLFNSLSMHLRYRPGLDRELIFNPVTSFILKSKAVAAEDNAQYALKDLRHEIREGFGASRQWADRGHIYPLFQNRIAEGEPLSPEHARVRSELVDYIKKEEQEKGPWNVLVVLLESFRADGLEGFEPEGSYQPGVTPNMTASLKEGIRFSEAMTTGDMTHLGQVAALCSLYSVPRVGVMAEAPHTELVCLPDIFAKEQYETYFFCGTDNSFDNQKVFHPFHQTRHVVGIEDFPPSTPRGNWGISDRAMFTSVVERLAAGKKPFFATILSLSNHWPFKLPEDAPKWIDRSLPPRLQLRQYVDWAWKGLYEGIQQELPHTIVVMASDHGVHFGDEDVPKAQVPYHVMRTHYRIPLAIMIPGMPASIAGSQLDNVISLADLPPTLLKILGKEDLPQQFMGHEAFSRREPLIVNWAWTWRWVDLDENGLNPSVRAQPLPDAAHPAWGALQRYNRFVPKDITAAYGKARHE